MIKTQLIFAYREMKRMKFSFLILLIQYILTVVILVYLAGGVETVARLSDESKRISGIGNVYYLQDVTPNEKILDMFSGKSDYTAKLKQLYELIYSKNMYSFPISKGHINIEPSALSQVDTLRCDGRNSSIVIETVQTNELFFDFFNIRFKNNTAAEIKTDLNKEKSVSVVVGSDFSGILQIGDTFEDVGSMEYVVCGILDENMSYIDVKSDRNFRNLNNKMIIIVDPNSLKESSDFDPLICTAHIVSDEGSQIKKIIKVAAELGIYSFFPRNLKDQFKYVLYDHSVMIQFQSFVFVLLMVFVILNFALSLLQYYRKNVYELCIHMISGATKADVFVRTVFRIAPIFLISTIVMFLAFKINSATLTALGISLLYSLALCLISLSLLSGVKINSVLRSYRDE